jgi:putative ABC transport system permease protein
LDAFPGIAGHENAVVVSIENFHDILEVIGSSISPSDQELWAAGDPDSILRSLVDREFSFLATVDTSVVLDTPGLESLLWTLGVLGALGAAAGLIAMLGLFLYLQARHRDTVVASALTRRMGFSRLSEYTTSLTEILGAALIALGVAAAAGLPVAAMMHVRLDLRPTLSPEPLLVIPMMTIAMTVLATLIASAVSAWRVQRSIDRADIAQVMRT